MDQRRECCRSADPPKGHPVCLPFAPDKQTGCPLGGSALRQSLPPRRGRGYRLLWQTPPVFMILTHTHAEEAQRETAIPDRIDRITGMEETR
jgi:hypothetical protein